MFSRIAQPINNFEDFLDKLQGETAFPLLSFFFAVDRQIVVLPERPLSIFSVETNPFSVALIFKILIGVFTRSLFFCISNRVIPNGRTSGSR